MAVPSPALAVSANSPLLPDIVIPASHWSRTPGASPSKRRKGKGRADDRRESVLSERDANEGQLVDVQSASGSTPSTNKTLYPPRTPSAFALSLLDKSPSLLKAQLSTPLIPLGTPVTVRKKLDLTNARKENETPSTRRGARRAGPNSPSPAGLAAFSPEKNASSSPPRTVRYSPSPRRLRSSPRKSAQTPLMTSSAPLTSASPTPAPTVVTPSSVIHCLELAHTSLSAPHFPHFSPSTPQIRTHASYRDEELTDCDADGSYWDADEDVSLSWSYGPTGSAESTAVVEEYEAHEVDQEMAVAVGGLSLDAASVEGGDVERDDNSADLAPTEVEDNDEEVGLVDEDAESVTSDQEVEVAAVVFVGGPGGSQEELLSEVTSSPDVQTAEAVEQANIAEADDLPTAVAIVHAVGVAHPSERTDEDAIARATTVDEHAALVLEAVGKSAPAEGTPHDTATVADEPTVAAVDPGGDEPVDDVDRDSGEEEAAPPNFQQEVVFEEALVHSSPPSPSCPEPVSLGDEAGQAAQAINAFDGIERVADPADLKEPIVHDSQGAQSGAAVEEANLAEEPLHEAPLPATPRSAVVSSTPTRPPSSALRQPAQLTSTAAPTAKRQLTKLTSTGAQRPAPSLASKTKLSALVPGSAATGSRLLGTSRLAVPKRDGATMTTSRTPGPANPSAKPAEVRRPSSALSSSTSSTLSSSSSASAPHSRVVVRPGVPSTATRATSSSTARGLSGTARPGPSLQRPVASAGTTTRPTTTASRPLSRPLTVSRSAALPTPASRHARSEHPSRSTKPTAAHLSRSTALTAMSSAPHVLPGRESTTRPSSASSASSMGPPRTAVRAPRAALAARKAAEASSTPSLNLSAVSPSKRRAGRIVDGKLEVPRVPAAPPTPTPAALPPAETPSFPPRCATPAQLDAVLSTLAPAPSTSPSPSRASPRRLATQFASVSPHRSPRRILVDQPTSSAENLAPAVLSTALLAPAEKLATTESIAIFEPSARPAPARATRRTRLAEIQPTVPPTTHAPDEVPETPATLRSSRRTIASTVAPAPPDEPSTEPLAVQPKAPNLRTRRSRLRLLTEEAAAAAAAELSAEPAHVAELPLPATVEDAQPAVTRPLPSFRPAPAVTQDELNRLTQRNTKKNQVAFNRIKLETVFIDCARPPSPTSKIRKAFGSEGSLGRTTTKEGREARAAKRRNALRSSLDGSELAAFAEELEAESGSSVEGGSLKHHFRAAGDDEQYFTPQKAGGALQSVAAGRKRSLGSGSSSASASPRRRGPKRVKWDRALVYEGPLDRDAASKGQGIIKPVDLDAWGNSTSIASLGKPTSITIRMRVFKDEQ